MANNIQSNIISKFHKALSKLKWSFHSVNIEVGRHNNIYCEQRLCVLCDKNEIEAEFYFVISCPVYRSLRIA